MKARVAPASNGHAAMARTRQVARQRFAVECATRLTDSDALVLGTGPAPPTTGSPRLLHLPSRGGHGGRFLMHSSRALELQAGADEVATSSVSVRDFAREGLAWLDARARAEVLEFIISATVARAPQRRRRRKPGEVPPTDRDARLSASLHELREALRERLPVGMTPGGPVALIDAIARVDRDAFFIKGRIDAGRSALQRVTAVSPEGARTDLLERAYWYSLAPPTSLPGDNAWCGFTAFFTCVPSLRPSGWLVEVETKGADLLEVAAPPVSVQAPEVIRVILEDLAMEPLPATRLRTSQIVPAVRRLQRGRRRAAVLETVKQFGAPPRAPTVTVIVPLYRRVDLIEHQLTQFADDPGMKQVDLVYVLDSPELEAELMSSARRLFQLYGLPFRVAVVSVNVGFAGANNLGASVARGRLLLLLNSDVFPESPGWLDAMVRFYDSLPDAGAVGPKLLYDDGTLQHAGMFFERLSDSQPWNNEHFFKGMHRDLPAASRSRPVPAVTGACLMVAADLYREMGGLSGDYVQGDFEDSELCLRLLEAGRQNWYFAEVALFHLEASSYEPDRRRIHDGFNRWLHTYRWGDRLSALAAASGS